MKQRAQTGRGRSLVILAAFGLLAATRLGAENHEFWPGVSYDPVVPTFEEVLGHGPGERITSHAEIMRYLGALAAAMPDRMKVFDYARTWEGRELRYGVIGSEANIARLEQIRTGTQRLADPRRLDRGEAERLIASLPVTVWLAYGVHGNEISSPDAGLLTAYHLLAARGDELVDRVMKGAIVVIDPLQNPDGRDRFVHNFRIAEGLEPDASPLAAEHNEPWPGGRTNHYYFDMNRDWFAMTQPETRGRIAALRHWLPQIVVDLHEMGAESTYFFPPEARPYNPHLTRDQIAAVGIIGRNNAKWFDRFGFDYFTREVYDAFYPGYGDSWPAYYGAAAMTYEQASARGLKMRRSDGTTLHFRDGVRGHFVASLSTAEAGALNREKLLGDFYRYAVTAIEEGKKEDVRQYILVRRGDTAAVDKLAALLTEQGIEVSRALEPFKVSGEQYPAGSYAIATAQPAKRLIRVLLDAEVPMKEDFIAEQERRRRRNLPDEIYDVTAWSLPLAFNVQCVPISRIARGKFEAVQPERIPPGEVTGGRATVAYLAPWGTAAAGRLLTAALGRGLGILSSDKPFVQNGVSYPGGTLIFKLEDNPEDLHSILELLAERTGAQIHATDTSWVEEGPNFGSRKVVTMRRPRVAIAWDRPTGSGSAGATRFVLERQFGYPVTVIRTRQLAGADLTRFHVVILPSGSGAGYLSALGGSGLSRLKAWVSDGGVLIGLGGAMSFLSDEKVELLAVRQESLVREGEKEKKPAAKKDSEPENARVEGKLLASEEEYLDAIEPAEEPPDPVAGVLARAKTDPDHWLTAGLAEQVNVMVQGRTIYTPIKIDKGVNAAYYLGPEELLASGYLWEENRKQLAFKPFVVVQPRGRGFVIGFTSDPNFRAFMDGLNLFFLNAVFRGAAHARPVFRE